MWSAGSRLVDTRVDISAVSRLTCESRCRTCCLFLAISAPQPSFMMSVLGAPAVQVGLMMPFPQQWVEVSPQLTPLDRRVACTEILPFSSQP